MSDQVVADRSPAKGAPENRPSKKEWALFCVALLLVSFLMGLRIDSRTARLDEKNTKYLVEDAGISVVFAKYIAAGDGVVYYPDGEIVEGYSNPLWTFLIAGLIRAGLDPFSIPRPMGIWFTALALFFGGLLVFYALPDRRRWLGLLVPPVAGQSGTVVIWAVAGLENGLFAATLLAALALFARERQNEKAFPFSAVAFFLAAVTRPEGMVYGGMAGLWIIATEIIPQWKLRWRQVVFALLFLVPFGVYQVVRYYYFAWPFPITFYGKTSADNTRLLFDFKSRGWKYIFEYLQVYHYWLVAAAAPIAIFSSLRWRESGLPFLALCFAAFFPIYAQGDWMEEWRFMSVVSSLMIVLAVLGAARIGTLLWALLKAGLRDRLPKAAQTPALLAVSLLIFLAASIPSFDASAKRIDKFVKNPIVNTYKLQIRGRYFRDMADRLDLRPGSLLDVDMGGIGEGSGMVIYDVGRLCDVAFGINQWDKTFVDDYVFDETRPDFMHAREGFGTGSTILRNPKLKTEYVLLPQDKRLGMSRPNGNYVRKDLIVADKPPVSETRHDFNSGLSVVSGEVYPAAVKSKDTVRFKVYWNAPAPVGKDLEVRYELVSESGTVLTVEKRGPVMGWYGTSEWKPDEYPIDLVKFKLPKNAPDGVYHVRISMAEDTEPDVFESPWTVEISEEREHQAVEALMQTASESAAADPDAARKALDDLFFHRLDAKEQKAVAALNKELALSYLSLAKARFEAGDETEAARLAIAARKLQYKNRHIQAFCKKLADLSYERGRRLQKEKKKIFVNKAYGEYMEALRRCPKHSWARRGAEETRPSGVLRRGLRKLPLQNFL